MSRSGVGRADFRIRKLVPMRREETREGGGGKSDRRAVVVTGAAGGWVTQVCALK